MSFTERNFPPMDPAGEAIPDGVRVSLINWFVGEGITSDQELWPQFCQREGYGGFQEIADDISRRFGEDAGRQFADEMADHFKREQRRMSIAAGHDYNAEAALRALPTPHFLDVLELAVASSNYRQHAAVEEINRLFAKRGIYYKFSSAGLAEWHGDQKLHGAIVRPAIDSLVDSRLAGARSEFEAALAHMRSGTAKDFEDAIDESAKSVESVMKVLAHERGIKLGGKETARPLFEALAKASVVVPEADNAVLVAARLRNAYGGHGSGSKPRNLPPEVPELAVRGAASAITYLAAML